MKKEWTKPVVSAEEFVANEYVATCYGFRNKGNAFAVVKANAMPLDGKCDAGDALSQTGCGGTANYNNVGFAYDKFDYVSNGIEAKLPTNIGGWYYSGSTSNVTMVQGDTWWYCAGPIGNDTHNDKVDRALFLGTTIPIDVINGSNCAEFNCGPNAS